MNNLHSDNQVKPSLLATLRTRMLIFGAVGLVASWIDANFGSLGGLNTGLAIGMGFGAGLSISLYWTLLSAVTSRLNWLLSLGSWLAPSLFAGGYLAYLLNAFLRLGSEHNSLALVTIIGCLGAGAGVGLLSWLIEPRVGSKHWTQELVWRRFTVPVGAFLLGLGLALVILERRVFVGLYPQAHKAILVIGVFSLASGLIFLLKEKMPRMILTRPIWLIGLALLFNSFIDLHKDSDDEIHELRQRPIVSFSMDVLRSMTDVDRDDYSSLLGGGDCAPFNPMVNPGMREIPGNGIDDNCRLGDIEVKPTSTVKPGVKPRPMGPETSGSRVPDTSLVLITVDTVRADHLSIYGYKRRTTPKLERFATRSVIFDRAYASSAWTSLSISSMMRGLYPRRLQWTPVYETNKFRLIEDPASELREGEKVRITFTMPLNDPRPTLAQRLQAHGLYTAAIINDGYAEFLSEKMGVAAGFDRFENMDDQPKRKRTVRGTVNRAMKILREIPKDKYFFLWVHIFGPHDPSTKHKGSPKFGTSIKDKYDHELHYADAQLGRLLSRLKVMERQQRIATVITSDHGELFFKKRRYHGVNLHESSIKIPLIIRAPDWPAGRTETLASLVDVMPTMLSLAGAPAASESDGDNLEPYVFGTEPHKDRIRFAETWYLSKDGTPKKDMVAAFDGRYKVVHNRLKSYTKVVDQNDLKRRPKNIGLKSTQAKRINKKLEEYIEATSGPIWPPDK
ncbi:MAG: sulfatase-like hydrolase/transferase [Myxococcota bacterium]|nr:sulfatase-like hydrolase/transferase [Myxococcota bacterium]